MNAIDHELLLLVVKHARQYVLDGILLFEEAAVRFRHDIEQSPDADHYFEMAYPVACEIASGKTLHEAIAAVRANKANRPTVADAVARTAESDQGDSSVIWRDGEQPEAVSPEHPLEGLELSVLANWKENSRNVRQAHRRNPEMVETAVRTAVWNALIEELLLRTQGLQQHEAEEFTRPDMWKPPTFPTG